MKKSVVGKVIHKNKKYNRNNKQNNPKDFIYVVWTMIFALITLKQNMKHFRISNYK